MSDTNTPEPTEAEIEAQVAALAAELEGERPKEYIFYPGAMVRDGQVTVTPELVDALLQDYLFDRSSQRNGATHTEGDISLRVNYDDLKHLIELSGASVREIEFSAADVTEGAAE